ncbi:MAG: hypothetical protein H6700_08685 [Myxococcales bacterium]|nr:hypothetical protein [Myxococcales bacterium]MCB9520100.1 hypothetical protein [Myxococcales bacterium]MCB9531826.1 hypothetical protein [Myxococcales bacterium]
MITAAQVASVRAALRDAVLSREAVVVGTAVACLYVLMTLGRPSFFRNEIAPIVGTWPMPGLWPYAWSSLSSVVTRMLVPLLVIRLVFHESPRDWGYRLTGARSFVSVYAALFTVMVPIVWYFAGTPAFQRKYPFWHEAGDAWSNLLAYEARYFFIFLSGESFWRGFILFGLARRFGAQALSIAMIPYVIVHFGKPVPETFGAILTAYALGALALRHRSFALGVALHYTVAVTMDVLALVRGAGLPDHW